MTINQEINKLKDKELFNRLIKTRNIGIVAHIDAGKTTTTERILYYTKKIYKIGSVDEGTATMDYMVQEKEHGITITSAATFFYWKDYFFNLIDTPGHVDFTIEVERSMRVLDGIIVIIDAANGVQPQTETVWRQADKYNIPRIIYVNKMDKLGANFFNALGSIKERLLVKPIPIQIPIGAENEFKGVIDLINLKEVYWTNDDGSNYEFRDISDTYLEQALNARNIMLETISELDDDFMVKYLDDKFTVYDIYNALRDITLKRIGFVVLCGSSLKNIGVQLLLDAVIDFLPNPLDFVNIEAFKIDKDFQEQKIKINLIDFHHNSKTLALCFKVSYLPNIGRISFIRVYSGKLEEGMNIKNTTKDISERITKILKLHANYIENVPKLEMGDIGAVMGLKKTSTGDTIYNSLDNNEKIVLESINIPPSVIFTAIEAESKAEEEKLFKALERLSEEDPTFRYKINEETGQIIISGMGELHLEIIKDRMIREFNLKIYSGKPQVEYKETITTKAQGEYRFSKQISNKLQTAYVVLQVQPIENGVKIYDEVSEEKIPKKFIPFIKEGIMEALVVGPLSGYSCVNLKVKIIDGEFDPNFSTNLAFKVAAYEATKIALANANPILLEPVMKVEIIVNEEYLGNVINDLNSRNAEILEISIYQQLGNIVINRILALVPLREMFGYSTSLRSLTQGRATFTMELHSYKKVPDNILNNILGKIY
ncbi:MAG: elongation factor G [bacterium]